MPEIISCTECGKKLRVPDDMLGKKVRCPGCSVLFVASESDDEEGAGAMPAKKGGGPTRSPGIRTSPGASRGKGGQDSDIIDEEEDDYPPRAGAGSRRSRRRDDEDDDVPTRRKRRREDDEDDEDDDRPSRAGSSVADQRKGWRMARMGLNLVILAGWTSLAIPGVIALVGGIMLIFGGALLTSLLGVSDPDAAVGGAAGGAVGLGVGVIIFMIVVGILCVAEVAMRLLGVGLCMMTPKLRTSSAKGLAIAAFACMVAALVFWLGGYLFSSLGSAAMVATRSRSPVYAGGYAGNFSSLLSLVGFILWMVYNYQVAQAVRAHDAARSVMSVSIGWAVFAGLAGLLIVFMACGAGVGLAATVGAAKTGSGAATGVGLTVILLMIGGVLLVGGYVGMTVWYLLTLQKVRDAVADRLDEL